MCAREDLSMCIINIDIQTRNDLYFAITNNILTLKKKSFYCR